MSAPPPRPEADRPAARVSPAGVVTLRGAASLPAEFVPRPSPSERIDAGQASLLTGLETARALTRPRGFEFHTLRNDQQNAL
jgi:hypothetical protein